MIDPTLPPDLGAIVRDLADRVDSLERGETGLSMPAPFAGLDNSVTITSAAFAPVWATKVENPAGEVLVVESTFLIGASTTLKFKLVETISGAESDVLDVVGPLFFGSWRWEWLHGIDLGPDTRMEVQCQARRSAGAGVATTYVPTLSVVRPLVEIPGATSGGNPTAV